MYILIWDSNCNDMYSTSERRAAASSNDKACCSRCNLHHEDVGCFVPKPVDCVVVILEETIEVDFISQPI